MLSKLLTLLSTAKGAAAAGVVAAAAVGTGVTATNQDVQNALNTTVQNVTESLAGGASNKPAVVAARNDAENRLRSAFQDDQQKLQKLHSTHVDSTNRATLDDTVKAADAKLRARLTQALDDVAALTLGREGRESPKPTGSPDVKASFTPEAQAKVKSIVNTAITDMDTIVSDAMKAVAALPTFEPGKPADVGGGQSADLRTGKPVTVPTPHPTP